MYMSPSAPTNNSHTDTDEGTGSGGNVSLSSTVFRQGGGGGGGSAGKGGDGGTVPEDLNDTASDYAEDGADGVVISLFGDPAELLAP